MFFYDFFFGIAFFLNFMSGCSGLLYDGKHDISDSFRGSTPDPCLCARQTGSSDDWIRDMLDTFRTKSVIVCTYQTNPTSKGQLYVFILKRNGTKCNITRGAKTRDLSKRRRKQYYLEKLLLKYLFHVGRLHPIALKALIMLPLCCL